MNSQECKRPGYIRLTAYMKHEIKEAIGDMPQARFARLNKIDPVLLYHILNEKKNRRFIKIENYEKITGRKLKIRPISVDSDYFQGMARLWKYLTDETYSELYIELFPENANNKPNLKVFNRYKFVYTTIEDRLEKKFIDQGLGQDEIRQWINEIPVREFVPYEEVKPVLEDVMSKLDVGAKSFSNISLGEYESGRVKKFSYEIYQYLLELNKRLKCADAQGTLDIRAEVRNTERRYLFSNVHLPLRILLRRSTIKKYFGPRGSIWKYTSGKSKTISEKIWEKIMRDYNLTPEKKYFENIVRLIHSLQQKKRKDAKKNVEDILVSQIIKYNKDDYIYVDEAHTFLGMSKKTFDVLVAENIEMIRKVVFNVGSRYAFPTKYLNRLKFAPDFKELVRTYENLTSKDEI